MADNGRTHRRAAAHFASPGEAPRSSASGGGSRFSQAPCTSATSFGSTSSSIPEVSKLDTDVPAPISPSATGSFSTIRPGQGAVVATRETAAQAAESAHDGHQGQSAAKRLTGTNRPTYKAQDRGRGFSIRALVIMLAAVALVALAAIFVVGRLMPADTSKDEAETLVQEKQVDTSTGIEYGGYTYQVEQQDDGTYALTRTASGSSTSYALFTLEGEPVALVVNNGVFYLPENTSSGWDVVSYAMGDGSVATKLTGDDGNEITGTGSLSDASLSDGVLTLVEDGGATQEIALS